MKTREEMIQFCDGILEQAKQFVISGEVAPIAFIINDTAAMALPLNEIPSKDAWGPMIEMVKQSTKAHSVVMIMEGWAVMGEKSTNKEYMDSIGTEDYIPPSQHPDRIEILQVTAKSEKFKEYFKCLKIIRDGDNISFTPVTELSSKDGESDMGSMYCRFTDGDYTPEQKAAMH